MACQRGDQDESWLENTPTMGLDLFPLGAIQA
jgi:hypothetical protein